ncbi:MAG TPA: response regulator [Pseudoduganella sp.]
MENIVLIIDDNRDTVDTLTALFIQHGWLTERAYNGRDGIEAVGRLKPAYVISDLAMPGLSGYDVAEELRRTYGEHCPILIALTGWDDPGVAEQALAAGFSIVLNKPLQFEQLMSAMKIAPLAEAELPLTPASPPSS